jgi:hypothetical protein
MLVIELASEDDTPNRQHLSRLIEFFEEQAPLS